RAGVTQLSPKQGVTIQDEDGGWRHDVLTVSPGIPGDSGSGFLNANGQAVGILSVLNIAPLAGTNGIGDVSREIAYMQASSSLAGVTLVPGAEPAIAGLPTAVLGVW